MRIRLHWGVKVYENYSAEFELEALPSHLRERLDALFVKVVEEDGDTDLTGDVMDFTYTSDDDDIDSLVAGEEEKPYSSVVEDRYIHGVEVMPDNPIVAWMKRATREPWSIPARHILDNWDDTVGVAIKVGAISEQPTDDQIEEAREELTRIAN